MKTEFFSPVTHYSSEAAADYSSVMPKQCGTSLKKLASLPDETKVYCGHEYTLENYEFALQIEPNNPLIKELITEIKQGEQTIPSTIAQEKVTNIFLQANSAEVFAELRRRKDKF